VAQTGADGRFEIQFARAQFGHTLFEQQPDVYALVYDGTRLLTSTRDAPHRDLAEAELNLVIYAAKQQSSTPQPSIAAPPPAATSGGQNPERVEPAQFGQQFIATIFTASLIADQSVRLVPSRHFRETSNMSFGPLKVRVTYDALLGQPSAEQKPDHRFAISFPVELQVRITGQIGPFEVEERFEVSTKVPLELELQIFDSLALYLDAHQVSPDSIDVTIERESWTEFSRGEVDKGVRKGLADRFNTALLESGHTRSIDVLGLVQQYLGRSASA
jgi:hypothetical protein